jgi:hypothetical protein
VSHTSIEPDTDAIKIAASPITSSFTLMIAIVVVMMSVGVILGGWSGGQTPPWVIGDLPARFWGVLGVAWFGFAAIRSLRGLLGRPHRLEISERGIINRTGLVSSGLIPWSEIEMINPRTFYAVEMVLRDPVGFRRRQPLLRRFVMALLSLCRAGPTMLFSLDLAVTPSEMVELVDDRLEAHELAAMRSGALLGSPDQETAEDQL